VAEAEKRPPFLQSEWEAIKRGPLEHYKKHLKMATGSVLNIFH
jgi:hypothetical protein